MAEIIKWERIKLANIIDRTGEINYNTFGSKMIIKEYRESHDINVYFPEYNWTSKNKQYDKFIKGNIKCPYERRFYNKGYLGEGIYKARINNKDTKCYSTWCGMLERCYNKKYHKKYPTYEGCEVEEHLLNFQNFAKWYYDNYYEVEGDRMCLDKDILCKGNKLYSRENCIFVPNRINTLFIKCDRSRGNYPVGVSYDKSKKKYRSLCYINGKLKHLGRYKTPEEAFQAYKTIKEKYIKEIAEQYKNVIPQKLYNAMIKYEIEIDD
mgnify:CR=1 FL=1